MGAQKGLQAQLAAMLTEHQNGLLQTARRLTNRNEDRSQDLVQETFLKAMRAIADGQFHEGGNMRAWLVRILTNLFINEYRRSNRWDADVSVDEIHEKPQPLPAVLVAPTSSQPEQAATLTVFDESLEAALMTLSPDLRTTILLVDVEEMSYEEAARTMEVPVGTVRSRLSRARNRLQDMLAEHARQMGWTRGE